MNYKISLSEIFDCFLVVLRKSSGSPEDFFITSSAQLITIKNGCLQYIETAIPL